MIYRGPGPDPVIPDLLVSRYVLEHAREHGERLALVDARSGDSRTYAELADGVDAMAGALAARGVGPGQVVALLSHNQPAYAAACFGVLAAGAVLLPVNPLLTVDEVVVLLRRSRATAVVSAELNTGTAEAAAGQVGIRHRFVLGRADGFTPVAELLGAGPGAPRLTLDPATALAAVPFSSGTTGSAKAVGITHRNIVANIELHEARWPVAEHEVLAGTMPFFHIYGLTVVLSGALRAGATLVTLPRYDLGAYLAMIEKYRVTRAFLAPPMVFALATAAEVDEHDLSSLRLAVCGAAPLDVELARRAEARLGCRIQQGYALTEASPVALAPSDRPCRAPTGSVGPLVPGTEARVVDPDSGEDRREGEPGELWVRGPQVTPGYVGDPTATREAIVEGRWLRTGDLVRIDGAANLWIVDRLKEVIKYKGYQVTPSELEALLLTRPDVGDVAVVGVPHREAGEVPLAVVVANGPVDAEELMAWVAERVAPHKKVRGVRFVDAIPRSATGKILRRLLRDTSSKTGRGTRMSVDNGSVPTFETVSVEIDDAGIGWLYFDRPDKRNAMSPTLNREMINALETLEERAEVRVVVLTGRGNAWSAGMDLREYFREVDQSPPHVEVRARRDASEWQWRRLLNYAKPTIAMVNGWCFGGAFTPLVCCDLAVAADDATFGLSEVNWGIPPGGLVSRALAETIPARDAMWFIMTGETFDGRRAAQLRLVNEAVPADQLRARTVEIATRLAGMNTQVLRAAKVGFRKVRRMSWDEAEDYLYAKVDATTARDPQRGRAQGLAQFLDEKSYRPGLGSYQDRTPS
jgi:acyl-CoA synthetase (AMP-forming)/AMP-acid ligase II/enoyl-CoA hydratase/carnithine racemase